jgi:hypothetical protein
MLVSTTMITHLRIERGFAERQRKVDVLGITWHHLGR